MATYVGTSNLKSKHAQQLAKFEAWAAADDWRAFHSSHYDWWAFPTNEQSSRGVAYTLDPSTAAALRDDADFIAAWTRGVELVMQGWGWDLARSIFFDYSRWDDYAVRLYKAGRSAQVLEQDDVYASLVSAAKAIADRGGRLVFRSTCNSGEVRELWNKPVWSVLQQLTGTGTANPQSSSVGAASATSSATSGPQQQQQLPHPHPLPQAQQRELTRDTAILREYAASDDPDVLVLYHHLRDRAFDAFNAQEYHDQVIRYIVAGMSVVFVAPRSIARRAEYYLVGLRHSRAERNVLCELAFLCRRQFCGIAMLVQRRCAMCNKVDGARTCSGCHCVAFCSKTCQRKGWGAHKKLCKLVDAQSVVVETESIDLEL